MLTVPEAAKRAGRDPETIRRWIRGGKLQARKVGTQHIIEEGDLDALLHSSAMLPLPESWRFTGSGRPMPDVVAAVRRSRRGH
jgi:excisionase family DNA binding protein